MRSALPALLALALAACPWACSEPDSASGGAGDVASSGDVLTAQDGRTAGEDALSRGVDALVEVKKEDDSLASGDVSDSGVDGLLSDVDVPGEDVSAQDIAEEDSVPTPPDSVTSPDGDSPDPDVEEPPVDVE